jgi:carboxyl-terminal processing protease
MKVTETDLHEAKSMVKHNSLWRWIVIVGLLVAPWTAPAQQQVAAPTNDQGLATVDQLKTEAFRALRGGQFDRTSELISKAASLSNDPALTQMSAWLTQFQSQRQEYVAERTKAYDKSVSSVKTLLDNNLEEYAIDKLADAYLLAQDKEVFRKEAWVNDLVTKAQTLAASHEKASEWRKAQRLYSNLTSIEPTNVQWKDRFKSVTGRLRLLAMYTPDQFKKIIEDETKSREKADQLINPTTQPATKPAREEENESFKTDWRDTLRGIRMEMLTDALDDATQNYWKDVDYKTLTVGGLEQLQALASTPGLEQAFPAMKDEAKRGAFLTAVNQGLELINKAPVEEQPKVSRRILYALLAVNQTTVQLPEEVLVNEFADGAFGELDPFSTMIWPGDLEDFNKSTQGEFSGVGIQIQLDDDGNLKVVSPLEDSPAYKQKIHAGDIITRINGKSAKGISINQAVKNITGPSGTYVTLTIKSPDGTVKDHTIRRETIRVASVKGYKHRAGGGWDYFVDPDQKIGYVRMTNFTKETDHELTRALADMQRSGAKAMILDLRNNPGGLLTAATEVSDRFLNGGLIVSTKGERDIPGQPPITATKTEDDISVPLVVLVNQLSASASEIVSGALQDQKRALVVGERTFGKGSVQMLFPLAGKSAALKLTTSHYYLPSGRCIHKEDNSTTWGVDPDLTVEMTREQMTGAQEVRQDLEVLHELPQAATTQPAQERLLAADPQLSAAVLLLRLQLAGATL